MKTCADDKLSVVKTKNGSFTLRVKGEDGALKTLHSLYDPESEARNLVSAFAFDGKGILVVLGLGLGYHVAALAEQFPDAEIIVIESMPGIYEAAKEHGPALNERVRVLTGLPPDEAIREITRYQTRGGLSPVSVFVLRAAVSAYAGYYGPILKSLKNAMSVRLWDRLKYAKFKTDTLNVMLVDSGYFLVREVEKAIRTLGHKVIKLQVRDNKSEELAQRLMNAILEHRPDFILTINHLGFDEEGVMTSLLRSIEMPVASWYVDSPKIIVAEHEENVSPYVSLFLWDKEYMEQMADMGFESVAYLPLATDTDVFKPLKIREIDQYSCDAGFVGNSLVDETRKKMEKIKCDLLPLVEKAAERLSTKRMSFDQFMNDMGENDLMRYRKLSSEQRLEVESAVLWKATLEYRLSCIRKFAGFDFSIHGDDGWKEFPETASCLEPPLHYYKELPAFYNACRINFNATHLQMSGAVNQRVFDVPACGAFVLTDYQKSIDGLFDVGKEIVVFRDREEIPGLVRYFLNNPSEREAVAGKGRERVLREHTYKHRLSRMVEAMKRRYKV